MGRAVGEPIKDVGFTVSHHRHPRSTRYFSSPLPSPLRRLQPADRLAQGMRAVQPAGLAPRASRQKLRINGPQYRAALRLHRDHRMQETAAAAAAIRPRDHGILDRQNIPPPTHSPRQAAAVRAAAVRAKPVPIISSTVTAGVRKNRVISISPARRPPNRRTRTRWPPGDTSRASKSAPLFRSVNPQNTPMTPASRHPFPTRDPAQTKPRNKDGGMP